MGFSSHIKMLKSCLCQWTTYISSCYHHCSILLPKQKHLVAVPLKMLQAIRGIYMERENVTQDLQKTCSPLCSSWRPSPVPLGYFVFHSLHIPTSRRNLNAQVYLCASSSWGESHLGEKSLQETWDNNPSNNYSGCRGYCCNQSWEMLTTMV